MSSVKKAHDHFNKGTDWRMLEQVDEFSVSLSCNDNCFTKVTLVIMLYLRLSVIINFKLYTGHFAIFCTFT